VIPPIATDVTDVARAVYTTYHLCVRVSSVTLVHRPIAVGRNEMPFGRDILVVPSNIVLDKGRCLFTGRGDL